MTNFCKDCKHVGSEPSETNDPPCNAPQNFVQNVARAKYLVTGIEQPVKKIRLGASCTVCRQYDEHPNLKVEMCGVEGKWFEVKEQ